jgi:hypothetical protein
MSDAELDILQGFNEDRAANSLHSLYWSQQIFGKPTLFSFFFFFFFGFFFFSNFCLSGGFCHLPRLRRGYVGRPQHNSGPV